MNYRLNKFFSRKLYEADTTEVIDINIQDVISNIVIFYETLAGGGNMLAHPAAGIEKIELVDGSDVLFSLDGYEAEALNWYESGGKFPANWNCSINGSLVSRAININFGRYLWDRELAFDPKQFNNPQLRITLDVGAMGMTSDKSYLTCFANLFDEQPAGLKGFLMTKEFKQWTMGANVHEYTDLPVDYNYRALYHRAFLVGTESHQCVANIKLSEDQDKRIPYDCSSTELIRYAGDKYPLVKESFIFGCNVGQLYLYVAPTTMVTSYAAPWAAAAITRDITLYDGDGGRLKVIGLTNPGNAQITSEGRVPHAVFEIPFGLKDEINDWYDVRGFDNLRADIKGGAAAQGYLFGQQYRPY